MLYFNNGRAVFFNKIAFLILGFLGVGIASHVFPNKTLPNNFFRTPPHCLKKNGVLNFSQSFFIFNTHSSFIGRAPGPDSPPTITQSIVFKSKLLVGAIRGSMDKNLTALGTDRKSTRLNSSHL